MSTEPRSHANPHPTESGEGPKEGVPPVGGAGSDLIRRGLHRTALPGPRGPVRRLLQEEEALVGGGHTSTFRPRVKGKTHIVSAVLLLPLHNVIDPHPDTQSFRSRSCVRHKMAKQCGLG